MTEFHDGHEQLVVGLHQLMEEADVVVAYNGNNFDRPVMNAEFLKYDLGPPPPSKMVDLYQVVKRQFRLISNRLDYVVRYLGHPEGKVDTGGFELWSRCLDGEAEAWEEMLTYNARDVEILEWLYHRLKPWIPNHPNHALYVPAGGERVCPTCGSTHVQSRGVTHTSTMTYRRYQCMDCKTWSRERLSEKQAEKPRLVRDNTK